MPIKHVPDQAEFKSLGVEIEQYAGNSPGRQVRFSYSRLTQDGHIAGNTQIGIKSRNVHFGPDAGKETAKKQDAFYSFLKTHTGDTTHAEALDQEYQRISESAWTWADVHRLYTAAAGPVSEASVSELDEEVSLSGANEEQAANLTANEAAAVDDDLDLSSLGFSSLKKLGNYAKSMPSHKWDSAGLSYENLKPLVTKASASLPGKDMLQRFGNVHRRKTIDQTLESLSKRSQVVRVNQSGLNATIDENVSFRYQPGAAIPEKFGIQSRNWPGEITYLSAIQTDGELPDEFEQGQAYITATVTSNFGDTLKTNSLSPCSPMIAILRDPNDGTYHYALSHAGSGSDSETFVDAVETMRRKQNLEVKTIVTSISGASTQRASKRIAVAGVAEAYATSVGAQHIVIADPSGKPQWVHIDCANNRIRMGTHP